MKLMYFFLINLDQYKTNLDFLPHKTHIRRFNRKANEYYEPLEHCLGSLEQVKSKGWSRTEPAPIF